MNVERALRGENVVLHLVLDCLWDLHVLHCGVRRVELFLELCCLSVDSLKQHRHVTEDVGVDNRANQNASSADSNLPPS